MAKEKSPERIRDAERTIATLKQATIDQLISNGFSGLSIIPILKKAGVSRGALFYHFPTKDHLIAAAFEDLLEKFAAKMHAVGRDLRQGKISQEEFVVRIGDTFASDLFIGCMEMSFGLRVGLTLSNSVEKAIVNWRESLLKFWMCTFELPGRSQDECETHWAMASNVLRGHAFTTSFGATPKARKHLHDGFAKLFLQGANICTETPKIIQLKNKSTNPKGD